METNTISAPADAGIAAARYDAQSALEAAQAFKEQLARPTGADILVRSPTGRTFKVRVRLDHEAGRRRLSKKARVYVHGAGDSPTSDAVLSGFAVLVGAPSIHTKRGDFPALDKAWDAFNCWIVEQKTRALATVMEELVDDGEELMEGATFSRKAGCSCGCSPGFVVEGLPPNRDLWVEEVRS